MSADNLRVFISSSMFELAEERKAVKEALEEHQVDIWIYEVDAGARPDPFQETYYEEIDKADVYIGFFWKGLGKDTLLEFEYAERNDKPIFLYEKITDLEGQRTAELQAFLDKQNGRDTGYSIGQFKQSDQLKTSIKRDLSRWLTRNARLRRHPAESEDTPEDRRRLRTLTGKVEREWIEGFLQKTVHAEALIELRKQSGPDAVPNPWEGIHEKRFERNDAIIENTHIRELFDEAGASLLILGEPGSGKTITLLELTRTLIQDVHTYNVPVYPVYLNLSSWTRHHRSFYEWIVNELSSKYKTPEQYSRDWLDRQKLILLLDGLDEVHNEARPECVDAINAFLTTKGAAGIVVCCRKMEYDQLQPRRIDLNAAYILRSLTREQILAYVDAFEDRLRPLRELLTNNAELLELASTPLMLDIMCLSFMDKTVSPEDMQSLSSSELFDRYIEEMFTRKGVQEPEEQSRILTGLSNLASGMKAHSATLFQIEELQASWLKNKAQYWTYLCATRLAICGILGLTLGVFFNLAIDGYETRGSQLVAGLVTGFFAGSVMALLDGIRTLYPVIWSKLTFGKQQVTFSMYVAVMSAAALLFHVLAIQMIPGFGYRSNQLLVAFVFGGLFFGVQWGYRSARRPGHHEIRTVEAVRWKIEKALGRSRIAAIFGAITALGVFAVVADPVDTLLTNALYALIFALCGGLILGLPGFLFGGFDTEILEHKTRPNEGITLSIKYGLIAGLSFWLFLWLLQMLLVSGRLVAILNGPAPLSDLVVSLLNWLPIGILLFLWFGGNDAIHHGLLRLLLFRKERLPLRLVPLLDTAKRLIFVREVGGKYVFIHRTVLEHFAKKSRVHDFLIPESSREESPNPDVANSVRRRGAAIKAGAFIQYAVMFLGGVALLFTILNHVKFWTRQDSIAPLDDSLSLLVVTSSILWACLLFLLVRAYQKPEKYGYESPRRGPLIRYSLVAGLLLVPACTVLPFVFRGDQSDLTRAFLVDGRTPTKDDTVRVLIADFEVQGQGTDLFSPRLMQSLRSSPQKQLIIERFPADLLPAQSGQSQIAEVGRTLDADVVVWGTYAPEVDLIVHALPVESRDDHIGYQHGALLLYNDRRHYEPVEYLFPRLENPSNTLASAVEETTYLVLLEYAISMLQAERNADAISAFNVLIDQLSPPEAAISPDIALYYRGFAHFLQNDLTSALADVDRFVASNDQEVRGYIARGNFYAELGRLPEAIADFEYALELVPGVASSYYNLGRMYEQQRDDEKAIEYYTTCISLEADYYPAYEKRAYLYLDQGQYEGALQDFELLESINQDYVIPNLVDLRAEWQESEEIERRAQALIAAHGEHAEPYLLTGLHYANYERNRRAYNAFRKAFEYAPTHISIIEYLLGDYFPIYDDDDLESELERCSIQNPPTEVFQLIYCASVAYWFEDEQAFDTFSTTVLARSSNSDQRAMAHLLLAVKDFEFGSEEEGLLHLQQAHDLSPDAHSFLYLLGEVYEDMDDPDAALIAYTRAIELDSTYSYSYQYRGDVYRELGSLQNALSDYRRAIELDSSISSRKDLIGLELDVAGYTLAGELLSVKLATNPRDADAYYAYGETLHGMNLYNEALEAFKQSANLDPVNPLISKKLSATYFETGHFNEAIRLYDAILATDSTDLPALFSRGRAHFELGNFASSLNDLRRLHTYTPEFSRLSAPDTLPGWIAEIPESMLTDAVRAVQTLASFPEQPDDASSPPRYDLYIAKGTALYDLGLLARRYRLGIAEELLVQARDHFTIATEQEPTDGSAFLGRSYVNSELGFERLAQSDLERAVQLDPALITEFRRPWTIELSDIKWRSDTTATWEIIEDREREGVEPYYVIILLRSEPEVSGSTSVESTFIPANRIYSSYLDPSFLASRVLSDTPEHDPDADRRAWQAHLDSLNNQGNSIAWISHIDSLKQDEIVVASIIVMESDGSAKPQFLDVLEGIKSTLSENIGAYIESLPASSGETDTDHFDRIHENTQRLLKDYFRVYRRSKRIAEHLFLAVDEDEIIGLKTLVISNSLNTQQRINTPSSNAYATYFTGNLEAHRQTGYLDVVSEQMKVRYHASYYLGPALNDRTFYR